MPTNETPPEPLQPLHPRHPLREGGFAGPAEFAQLVRDAIATAVQQGWSEMVWSDASFEDWPLHEKSVVDALQGWSRTGRKLTLLASRFDSITRYQPRFVRWRVMWDHIVECRVCKQIDASEMPSALWSPQWCLRRTDMVRSTGISSAEPQRRVALKEALDECRRHSGQGFSASTLGL